MHKNVGEHQVQMDTRWSPVQETPVGEGLTSRADSVAAGLQRDGDVDRLSRAPKGLRTGSLAFGSLACISNVFQITKAWSTLSIERILRFTQSKTHLYGNVFRLLNLHEALPTGYKLERNQSS